EGRINTLIDLIPILKIEIDHLSLESRKVLEDVLPQAVLASGEDLAHSA
ncbi:MAG: hypothetical protein RL131_57, partial [Bacteroidota bacterium]